MGGLNSVFQNNGDDNVSKHVKMAEQRKIWLNDSMIQFEIVTAVAADSRCEQAEVTHLGIC